jgi:hypothetical protein
VERADLERHRVRFGDAGDLDGYYAASAAPPTGTLRRAVGAGELLPRGAVGGLGATGTVQVPVPVEPEQVPPSVGAGSVVDVYVLGTGGRAAGGAGADAAGQAQDQAQDQAQGQAAPGPARAGVSVVEAPDPADSFVVSGKRQLVLAVPEDDAERFFALLGVSESPTVAVVRRS